MLATTVTASLHGTGRGTWIAVGTNLAGYAVAWWRARPGPLRTRRPYLWPPPPG